MEMEDGLPGVASLVDHHPIPVIETEPFTDLGGGAEKTRRRFAVTERRKAAQVFGVDRRDDENVRRRLRIAVAKRDDVLVTKDLVRGKLAADDLAKQTVARVVHVVGLMSSKWYSVSGLGTNPPIDDRSAIGTSVCTRPTAGTWSWMSCVASR